MHKDALIFCTLIFGLSAVVASAETVDGQIVSLDTEGRSITLVSGETFPLGELVSMDGLEVGQSVRVTLIDETIDVSAIDILEAAEPDALVPDMQPEVIAEDPQPEATSTTVE
jgi:hypothetical protein